MNNSSAISLPPPRFLSATLQMPKLGPFSSSSFPPFFILGSTFNTLSLISVYYIRFFNLVDEEEEKNEGRGEEKYPGLTLLLYCQKPLCSFGSRKTLFVNSGPLLFFFPNWQTLRLKRSVNFFFLKKPKLNLFLGQLLTSSCLC